MSDKAEELKAQRKAQTATVILAALAVIGTIAGAVVANMGQSNTTRNQLAHEESERLADLRRETYTDFVALALDMQIEMLVDGSDGLTKSEIEAKFLPKFRACVGGYSKVIVIGTKVASDAAYKVMNALPYKSKYSLGKESLTRSQVDKATDAIGDELDNFVNAIQPELHLSSPLPSLESPPTS
jgi:hypothetical protein